MLNEPPQQWSLTNTTRVCKLYLLIYYVFQCKVHEISAFVTCAASVICISVDLPLVGVALTTLPRLCPPMEMTFQQTRVLVYTPPKCEVCVEFLILARSILKKVISRCRIIVIIIKFTFAVIPNAVYQFACNYQNDKLWWRFKLIFYDSMYNFSRLL